MPMLSGDSSRHFITGAKPDKTGAAGARKAAAGAYAGTKPDKPDRMDKTGGGEGTRRTERKKGLLSLKEVLSGLLRREGSVFAEIHFLRELQRRWPELAGEAIAETGRPVSFKSRTLTIALENSSSLHEMHFVKEALRNKLNRLFPHIQTSKIRLKARPARLLRKFKP